MNTEIDLLVQADAPPSLAFLEVRLLFEQQEQRFSRFRSESLLSRLNAGEPIADPWLDAALQLALEAHRRTGGRFNPAILPALEAAGYDRTFEQVAGGHPRSLPAPDLASVLRRSQAGWVLEGARLDLGGMVKGWTADLAIEHLRAAGFASALVNAGGDIRVSGGETPGAPGWTLSIDDLAGSEAWQGRVTTALATSTTRKRRWRTASGAEAHHLIDPRSGLPAAETFAQVSVIAESCWLAETWAKAILIGGEDALAEAADAGVSALALRPDGSLRITPAWPAPGISPDCSPRR